MDYRDWHDLHTSALHYVDANEEGSSAEEGLLDLLYVLARDNEAEVIRQALVGAPVLLEQLAILAIDTAEADAKWQIAVSIAEAKPANASALMRPFLEDESEYVRRRTLLAFASIAPGEAEVLALRHLDDPFEYTRLAALEVLSEVNYELLDQVIKRLMSDVSPHVRIRADELRNRD